MKKKELKTLAKKIAELETIIQANEDSDAVHAAQDAEIALIGKITDMSALDELDELIQEYMQNK